ncbi:DICT sensory domain-containing protein [Halostagnicola kamekurae]|uniref:Diguanylate Cyclase and Two-component system sensory domain-containing protein n=1 Tax=Halostagnicola kamekurae TaxID=619731 RepID=A0A1I6SDD4_9EURY|nr:DICT sensory domain-containing protein [Halostagnicola kamekurae]SFS74758.1 Diguanylate Cyclase and Two-component system sensory domain-containing protein [Halostagnicola kamekurae]
MTLASFLERVEETTRTVELYAPEPLPELAEHFERGTTTATYRSLPAAASGGFLVVLEDGDFRASVDLATARQFLEPPIAHPWAEQFVGSAYRQLLEVLENTSISALTRRQLLATARDIEHRAWHAGRGTLRVGFQDFAAYEDQLPVYDRLARETALDIHVYARADWTAPVDSSPTIHAETTEEIGTFWFLVYEDGGESFDSSALLAREDDDGTYTGFWSSDPELVADLDTYLVETYG